jgi:hypothetical protein
LGNAEQFINHECTQMNTNKLQNLTRTFVLIRVNSWLNQRYPCELPLINPRAARVSFSHRNIEIAG